MKKSYTYDPSNISKYTKDRMRFELGDVMTEGGADTCALCDEEYNALIPEKVYTTRQWKKAKLAVLESIFRRFAYEPDTKTGPVSFSFNERAKLWRDDYNALKKDLATSSFSAPPCFNGASHIREPYFFSGMMENMEGVGRK